MKFIRDGIPFDVNQFQTIEGIQYPVGWFKDPDNRAALNIIEWENAPAEPSPVVEVPVMVTRRQARQALLIKGHLDKVEGAIAALDDGTEQGKMTAKLALIEWQDSLNFERSRPLVIQIGVALGLGSEGLDDLFTFAASL